MLWTFERRHSPEYIRIDSKGVITADSFASMIDELIAHEGWEPRIPILFWRRTLNEKKPHPAELFNSSNVFIEKIANLAFTKIAVVFDTLEAFERGVRFKEATASESDAYVAIFKDEEQALSWLLSAATEPPNIIRPRSKANGA